MAIFKTGQMFELRPHVDLGGKSFCFTGKFSNHTKRQLKEFVESNNGKYHTTVTLSVDILVYAPNAMNSSKTKKAISYRIRTMSEYEFFQRYRF